MHGLIHLSFRQAMLEEHWVSDLQMASICLSTGEKEQDYINCTLIRNCFTDCIIVICIVIIKQIQAVLFFTKFRKYALFLRRTIIL